MESGIHPTNNTRRTTMNKLLAIALISLPLFGMAHNPNFYPERTGYFGRKSSTPTARSESELKQIYKVASGREAKKKDMEALKKAIDETLNAPTNAQATPEAVKLATKYKKDVERLENRLKTREKRAAFTAAHAPKVVGGRDITLQRKLEKFFGHK